LSGYDLWQVYLLEGLSLFTIAERAELPEVAADAAVWQVKADFGLRPP